MAKVKAKVPKVKSVEKDAIKFTDGTTYMEYGGDDLVDKYYKAVYDSLLGRDESKKENALRPYIDKSIKGMLNAERSDLGVKSLDKLEKLVKETTDYFNKSNESDYDYIEYKVARELFPWQKNVLQCKSDKITMLCGRRSGKSYLESAMAVLHCARPYDIVNGYKKNRDAVIIGLSSGWAEDIFWDNVKHFIDVSGLKAHVDNSDLLVTFSNGNTLRLRGNSNRDERSKIRGTDYSLIIIDECQSQKALGPLMSDVLGAIITARSSSVILSGTGSLTSKGYWMDVTTGSKSTFWTHFTATMNDNPTVPPDAMKKKLDEEFGGDANDVTYRREYLAENVLDTTRLVYPVFHKYDKLPPNEIINRMTIGIDYGSADSNAFVCIGKSTKGKMYVLDIAKFNRSDVDKITDTVKYMWDKNITQYKIPQENCICIADTSDQSISAQIQKKGVRIQNAVKTDRIQQIFDLRSSLQKGDISIGEEEKFNPLVEELECYLWQWDEDNKCVIYETDEDAYHPDLLAAMRYGWFYLKDK